MIYDLRLTIDEVVMCELMSKQLLRDGMMALVFRHDEVNAPKLERHLPRAVLRQFAGLVVVRQFLDGQGLRTDVLYPVLNMVQVRLVGGWREFVFIHRVYGTGVRDCVRLGVEAWGIAEGRGRKAEGGLDLNAFVQKLPNGVESGTEVFGVHLFAAEWMCANAVAVG